MADKYAGEVARTLRGLGCIVTSDPTSRHVEEPGRADLKVIRGGYGVCIEVKNGDGLPTINEPNEIHYYETWKKVRNKKTRKSEWKWVEKVHAGTGFDLTKWADNQRDWASTYCRPAPYQTEYWLALLIGVDDPHRDEAKVNKKTGLHWQPRRCWLFPYMAALALDNVVRQHQNRLPYRAGKHMNTTMQAYNIDAVTLLADYELTWAGKGTWTIPETHLFHKKFIALPALPLIDAGINEPERVPVAI